MEVAFKSEIFIWGSGGWGIAFGPLFLNLLSAIPREKSYNLWFFFWANETKKKIYQPLLILYLGVKFFD